MSDTEIDHKPKVMDASTFKVSDYLKNAVTLPEDSVSVYMDGATAWRYWQVKSEIEDLFRKMHVEQNTQSPSTPAGPRSITDPLPGMDDDIVVDPEDDAKMQQLEEEKDALLETLKGSRMVVHMRALTPKVIVMLGEQAKRETNAQFKDKETPSEADVVELTSKRNVMLLIAKSMQKIELPNGDEITAPFSPEQVQEFEDEIDSDEWNKVYVMYRELAGRAAIREATVDAGFPS